MDFGDFITLILFLIFIVSPFLKRKKAQKPGKSKQSGFSVLGKIREALKEAVREMEAQAEQARKKGAPFQEESPGRPSRVPSLRSSERKKGQFFAGASNPAGAAQEEA